ncbi:hypothetical protein WR25_21650 isoform B [Diploscapter pachys]|uniref:Uncharacterized protein n=1 Tax=Diploscapter pachys TaxID=2018661 RepID=A0A2A2K7W1_9BILA|nr:hypothetical protein WR25_21650 isoform B [Diploscapter pachys]
MTIETPMKEIHSDGRVLVDRIGYVEFPKEIIYKYEGKRIVANYAISNYNGHWGVWQLKNVLRVLGVHERFEDHFQPRLDYTDGVVNDTDAITNQVSDAEDDDGDDDPYNFGSEHCSGRNQTFLPPDAFDDEDDYNQPIGWSLHNDDSEKRNEQCGAGAYPDKNRDEWKDRRNDRNGEFNNWTPVGPVGFGGTQGWNERSNLHNRLAYRDEERRSSPSSRPSKYADSPSTRNVSRFSAPDVDQVPFGSMSVSSGSRNQANQGNQAPPPQVPGPSTILGPAGPDMTRPRSRHQVEPELEVQLPPRRATPEQDIGVVVEIGSNYLIVAVPYRGACIYEAAFFDANLKKGQFVHVVIEKLPRPGRECCEFSILEEPRLVTEEMDLPVTRINQKGLVEVLVRGTIRLDRDRNAYFESNVIDHILIDRAKARVPNIPNSTKDLLWEKSLKLIGVQDIEALCYFYFNDELNQWQWNVDSYHDTV